MRLMTNSRAYVRCVADLIIMPETDVIKKDLDTRDNDQSWFTPIFIGECQEKEDLF
jgi:hypothetical protein